MSGTYPTDPEFQAINVNSKHRNLVSETISGRVQTRAIGKQQFSFTAKYNPMTREEMMPVFAFIMSQQGRVGTFTIVPPVISSSSGSVSGSMAVNGAHTAGDSTISVDGFTGTIKAGDFVKFADHDKVYMVISDLTGAGSLSIEPAITSDLSNDEAVTYTDVPFKMRLNNDVQEYNLAANEYFEFEIDMIEAL